MAPKKDQPAKKTTKTVAKILKNRGKQRINEQF